MKCIIFTFNKRTNLQRISTNLKINKTIADSNTHVNMTTILWRNYDNLCILQKIIASL